MEGYRKACARLLERAERVDDERLFNDIAWMFVIGPDAVADYGPILQKARTAVESSPDESGSNNTLGVALYRAGKYDQAVERLNLAVAKRGGEDTASDWIFLALAHHRLGHAEEAGKWLQKAAAWIDRHAAKLPWPHRLEMELFRAEANAVVKPGNNSPR